MPAKLPPEMVRTNINLRLPRVLQDRLRQVCKGKEDPSMSDVAIAALERYLPQLERKKMLRNA